MKEMRSKAVVVLVNTRKDDFSKMPEPVKRALADPKLGSLIPRMAVFDKKGEKALGSLAYKQITDKKAMRNLENAIREYAENGSAAGGGESEDGGDTEGGGETPSKLGEGGAISDSELVEWISSKGTKVTARATRYAGGKLTLVRANGTSLQVTLDQLSDESRKAAEELIGK